MRCIVVGDPHVRPGDLEDAEALMNYVQRLAIEHNAGILVLGDLHHFHGIIHAEVLAFWHRVFRYSDMRYTALVGNHDMTGTAGSTAHALMTHHSNDVTVIASPTVIENVLFVPYCDPATLVGTAQAHASCPTVVCHATFNGSKYENGMYAKDGIDPELLPQNRILSGHIHAPQNFGKVWYPGAPRALTVSDANVERAVYLVEFERGELAYTQPFSLRDVVRQMYHLQDSPATPLEVDFDPRHKYHVDITGPSSWISERKPLFEGKARIRTFRTDKPTVKLKESEGISVSFGKYVSSYKPQFGTDVEMLKHMAKERTGVEI